MNNTRSIFPSLHNPIYRVELGTDNPDQSRDFEKKTKEVFRSLEQDVPDIHGDVIEIGQPVFLRTIKHNPSLDSLVELGLIEIPCAFLPVEDHHFISVKLEVILKNNETGTPFSIYDIYPQQVESRLVNISLTLAQDFRFLEESNPSLPHSVIKRGLKIAPFIYGLITNPTSASWTFESENSSDMRGIKTIFSILTKDTSASQTLEIEFRLTAKVRTKWGIFPVSVLKQLSGQKFFSLPWKSITVSSPAVTTPSPAPSGSSTGNDINNHRETHFKVYLSSTWEDLKPERQAVEKNLHRMRDLEFKGMEYFGTRPDTPGNVSLDELRDCHIYIGLFAHRYGSGITEKEYRLAKKMGIPRLIYIKDSNVPVLPAHFESDPSKAALLEQLKRELQQEHIVSFFSNPDHLASTIAADLHNQLNRLRQIDK